MAERLNAYELVLPNGTTRHFRAKRLITRGEPQPFTRDSVREILTRPFYTGQLPSMGRMASETLWHFGPMVSILRL
ncbi:MAG: hypothetical protein AB1566_11680 [Chloroflexota bacterium]